MWSPCEMQPHYPLALVLALLLEPCATPCSPWSPQQCWGSAYVEVCCFGLGCGACSPVVGGLKSMLYMGSVGPPLLPPLAEVIWFIVICSAVRMNWQHSGVMELQGGCCRGSMLLSAQSVTLVLSVIDGDLGVMNSKNLFKMQHPFTGREVAPSTDWLVCEA